MILQKNIRPTTQETAQRPEILYCETRLIKQHQKLLFEHLSRAERALFWRYRHQEKQTQFLGGRILSKYALIRGQGEKLDTQDIQILRTASQKPKIHTADPTHHDTHLSISHTHKHIAVITSKQNSPCDIAQITPRHTRAVTHYSPPPEKRIIQKTAAIPEFRHLQTILSTCIWGGKEVITKYLEHASLLTILQEYAFTDVQIFHKHFLRLRFLSKKNPRPLSSLHQIKESTVFTVLEASDKRWPYINKIGIKELQTFLNTHSQSNHSESS